MPFDYASRKLRSALLSDLETSQESSHDLYWTRAQSRGYTDRRFRDLRRSDRLPFRHTSSGNRCAPAPPRSPARATPPQRAARRLRLRHARLYMALFLSRAPIGRLRVTTRSRAAGRSRDPGEGRFRRDRRPLRVCVPVLRLRQSVGVLRAHSAICRVRYVLVKKPLWPKGLLRTALTHASGRELPDGITLLTNHMVETARTLPDASPTLLPCHFLSRSACQPHLQTCLCHPYLSLCWNSPLRPLCFLWQSLGLTSSLSSVLSSVICLWSQRNKTLLRSLRRLSFPPYSHPISWSEPRLAFPAFLAVHRSGRIT